MTNRTLWTAAVVSLLACMTTAGWGSSGDHKRPASAARVQYRIDVSKSRLIVETQTSGLSAMFAHDHKLEAGEFSGAASVVPGGASSGSLELIVKAASLHLIDEKDIGQRQAIETALRDDVLETAKYPEISFKSRSVVSERRGDGSYDVRLTGELRLHGVRRQVTLPARVSLDGDTLHAIGILEIQQTSFKITPFSFVSGTVAIKDTVTVSFDIVATRS